MEALRAVAASIRSLRPLIELGLNLEQRPQALTVTQLPRAFAQNPPSPAPLPGWRAQPRPGAPLPARIWQASGLAPA